MISFLFPKSKNIWVYGEWFGEKICDNSFYAFKERSLRKNIRKIWITRNTSIITYLRKQDHECYHAHSLKGLYYQARAKVFFCSVNSKDFCHSSITPRAIFFQLWHGLPLKKIGFDVENRSKLRRLIDLTRTQITDNYTYIISPSPSFDSIFSSAFKIPTHKIIRSHYPRCDGLFPTNPNKSASPYKGTKILGIYLPTHRKEGQAPEKIKSLLEQIKQLNPTLEELEITLLVKPHFYEFGNFTPETLGNIVICESLPIDLYSTLSYCDFIISDYSSVSLDYSITKRPIFNFTPDIDDYALNDRSGYFDYSDLLRETYTSIQELDTAIRSFVTSGRHPLPIKVDFPPIPKPSISAEFQRISEILVYGE